MINQNIKDTVLLIEDNENDYLILKRYLGDCYELEHNNGQGSIIDAIFYHNPKCILLDYNLGMTNGYTILKAIKRQDELSDISVIMLTNESDSDVIVQCLRKDAFHYLIKDKLNKDDLRIAVQQAITDTRLKQRIKEQHKEILRLSRTDDLTNLLNRRTFLEGIEKQILRRQGGKGVFSLALMDIDNFKFINDTYGHLVGDEALKIVAGTLKENISDTDYVCRYGGDEFIIALLELSPENLDSVMDKHSMKLEMVRKKTSARLKNYLNKLNNNTQDETIPEQNRVSVSMGITMCQKETSGFYELFKEADTVLYRVKEEGKDNSGYLYNGSTTVLQKEGNQ